MRLSPVIVTVGLMAAISCASPRPAERGDLVRIEVRPAVSEEPLEGRLIAADPDSMVVRAPESDLERTLAREDVLEIYVARPGYRRAIRITGCGMTAAGAAIPFLADPVGALGWSLWAFGEAQFAWGCVRPPNIWRPALLPSLLSKAVPP